MNRFLFIMLLLPAGSVLAQNETFPLKPFSKNPLHILKKPGITKADTADPDQMGLLKRYSQAAWLAQAKKSHTTSQGTVYQMPIDNMPCLVPDKRKVVPMPGIQPVPDSRMPNGFRVRPVVPKGRN